MQGLGRADIVDAGSRESGFSECQVHPERSHDRSVGWDPPWRVVQSLLEGGGGGSCGSIWHTVARRG
ncbi:unnamed protein product, partial [Staurois parvus]